jgi:hypothetical protein
MSTHYLLKFAAMNTEISPVLQSFYNDFKNLCITFQKISKETIQNGITDYPIFIASSLPVKLGILLFTPEKLNLKWYFYISMLEEMTKKGIIKPERIEAFKITYKSPDDYACFLLMLPNESHFVFVPYTHLS